MMVENCNHFTGRVEGKGQRERGREGGREGGRERGKRIRNEKRETRKERENTHTEHTHTHARTHTRTHTHLVMLSHSLRIGMRWSLYIIACLIHRPPWSGTQTWFIEERLLVERGKQVKGDCLTI